MTSLCCLNQWGHLNLMLQGIITSFFVSTMQNMQHTTVNIYSNYSLRGEMKGNKRRGKKRWKGRRERGEEMRWQERWKESRAEERRKEMCRDYKGKAGHRRGKEGGWKEMREGIKEEERRGEEMKGKERGWEEESQGVWDHWVSPPCATLSMHPCSRGSYTPISSSFSSFLNLLCSSPHLSPLLKSLPSSM